MLEHPASFHQKSSKRMQNFVADLNKIYCLKAHLSERIVDLGLASSFSKARFAIERLVEQTELELVNLDQIFVLLKETYSFETLEGLISGLELSFNCLTDELSIPNISHILFLKYLAKVKHDERACLTSMVRSAMLIDNSMLRMLIMNEVNSEECKLINTFASYYPESFTQINSLN
jgi:hypothetical protein